MTDNGQYLIMSANIESRKSKKPKQQKQFHTSFHTTPPVGKSVSPGAYPYSYGTVGTATFASSESHMEAPEKPSQSDCCGSGCTPCVFDVYERLLAEWRCGIRPAVESTRMRHDLLSPTKYRPYRLTMKTREGDVYVYIFEAESDNLEGILPYDAGQHLYANLGTISRPYTPISIAARATKCRITMLVKLYEGGAMSSLLDGLSISARINLRGPYGDFRHKAGDYDKYVMLAAGTGVAPMYAIAKSVLSDETDDTIVRLFYACVSLDSIPLRDKLRKYSAYWNFSVDIFVAKETDERIVEQALFDERIVNERITFSRVAPEVTGKVRVLICGSATFCETMKDYAHRGGVDENDIFVF